MPIPSSLPAGPNPMEKIMQMGMGFMSTACLHGVTSLGIPDLLKNGPMPVAALAKSTSVNEDALYRVLRALASAGVFSECAPRTFALAPPSELLVADAPGSMRPMILWLGHECQYRTFAEMPHAIKTGETVLEKVYGLSCFDFLRENPVVSEIFNDAMTAASASAIPAVLDAYDFSFLNGKSLVDIAGGHGMLLSGILKKYPEIRGVLFDLDYVLEGAKPRLAAANLSSRCRLETGDFFREVPAGDAYMMRNIIHDWNDEKASTILRNIHRASQPGAKVILVEMILIPKDTPQIAKWLDLEMLLMPGGRERTEEEYGALFAGAGFELKQVLPTKSPASVLEAVRLA